VLLGRDDDSNSLNFEIEVVALKTPLGRLGLTPESEQIRNGAVKNFIN